MVGQSKSKHGHVLLSFSTLNLTKAVPFDMPVDRSLTNAPNATGPKTPNAAFSVSGVASNGTFRTKTVLPSPTSDLA